MQVVRRFHSNFLTQSHFKGGKGVSLVSVLSCFLFSYLNWSEVIDTTANGAVLQDSNQWWRLFTTTFVHSDIEHFLSNSLMLFILTYFTYSFYGFGMAISCSYVMGAVINALTLLFYQDNTTLVGVSGVIYYQWGFWLTLFCFLQRQYSLIGRFLRVGAIFFILLIPTTYKPQTSYLAHYLGFLLGVGVGGFYFLIRRRRLFQYERWEWIMEGDDEDSFEQEY